MSPTPETDPTRDDFDQALRFLYDRIDYEKLVRGTARYPFRLQRITELMRRLGLQEYLFADSENPKVPLVHIAGTKGKGSIAAMVAAALTESGLRTGLFTSPHLHRLEERFRIDGQPCSQADVVDLVTFIREVTSQEDDATREPSFFELTTAMAMLHFDRRECDAIVLEVGLGGRLDSTNVCSPTVSAVSSIGLDHQHVLGNTLTEIAGEKAGIFKPGVPVVSGVTPAEPAAVIEAKARQQGSKLYRIGHEFDFEQQPMESWGCRVDYFGRRPPLTPHLKIELALEGQHQAQNAASAIAILDLLRNRGVNVSVDGIAQAMRTLVCPARVERIELPHDQIAIVDAAHNEDSIAALTACLRKRAAGRPVCVVFGTSADKAAEPMLRILADVADHLVLTRFWGNPRFRAPDGMLSLVPLPLRNNCVVQPDPIRACELGIDAIGTGGVLVVCGSFFLAAETRHWLMTLAESTERVRE